MRTKISGGEKGAGAGGGTPSDALAEEGVDAALCFIKTGPAAGALVFTGGDRAGARPAPDRTIPAVVQRIVGNTMFADVLPNLLAAPCRHRIDLHDIPVVEDIELVEFDHLRPFARFGLLPAQPGDPGGKLIEFLSKRDDFSLNAARIGVGFPKFRARLFGLLLRGEFGNQRFDPNAEEALKTFLELVSFGEEQLGIEGENGEAQAEAHRLIDNHEACALKARADAGGRPEAAPAPAENFLEGCVVELSGQEPDFFWRKVWNRNGKRRGTQSRSGLSGLRFYPIIALSARHPSRKTVILSRAPGNGAALRPPLERRGRSRVQVHLRDS